MYIRMYSRQAGEWLGGVGWGGRVGSQADRQNTGGFQDFKEFLQVKLLGYLFCLTSLQCYYSTVEPRLSEHLCATSMLKVFR